MNAIKNELTEKKYEEFLNLIYDEINIGSFTFEPGRILRELNPIAFRCGMAKALEQWQCSECDQIYKDQDEAEECCKE